MNVTDETKKLHRKQFETFKTVFKNIHKKCLEYDISSLTKFFEESDCEIAPMVILKSKTSEMQW